MTNTLKALGACALVSVLLVPVATAGVLFDDTFPSPGDPNDSGYYMYGGVGTTSWTLSGVPADSTLMDVRAMKRQTGGTQQNTRAIKQFSDFSFSSVGDSITVSMDIQAQGTTGILNVGFYDAPIITSNKLDGTYSRGTDGVYLYKDFSTDSTARYRSSTFNQNLSSSTSSIGDSVDHNITFTMTMTETGLEFSGFIAGSALETYIATDITTASGFSVNSLVLGVAGGGATTFFDNIVVSTIPEPNAVWLGIVPGCVALASVRRRKA